MAFDMNAGWGGFIQTNGRTRLKLNVDDGSAYVTVATGSSQQDVGNSTHYTVRPSEPVKVTISGACMFISNNHGLVVHVSLERPEVGEEAEEPEGSRW